jgi:hypothetical protein
MADFPKVGEGWGGQGVSSWNKETRVPESEWQAGDETFVTRGRLRCGLHSG